MSEVSVLRTPRQRSARTKIGAGMALFSIPVRAAWASAFAAAIVAAPAVGISVGHGAALHVVAAPCNSVTTNGSNSLNCGTPGGGPAPSYTGGCTNVYGNYQNCIVELLPPSLRPNRR